MFEASLKESYLPQKPIAIITGPPWLRTGTGRVIEAQIAYYRERGYRTAFIGVAVHPAHIASDPIWRRYREGIADLHADCVSIAALPHIPKPRTPARLVRHLLRRHTALDWIVELGSLSKLPDDVVAFTQGQPPTLIHVNHVYTIGFAGRLKARLSQVQNRIPMIVETHDVQAHIIRDNNEKNPWARRPDSLARLIRSETRRLALADVLIHLTKDDLEFFAPRLPDKPHVLAMPMIARMPPAKAALAAAAEPIDVLFVGTGHVANLEAVDWLFRQVWPHIAHLGLTLRIAGHIDELVRLRLPELYHEFRGVFTGPVADVAPYYDAARCLIAPMVSGRGISIKTIEALAFGKPIVGTSKAYRGMPMDVIQAAGLRPYDDAKDFADAIVRTLRMETIGATRYRALYDRLFSKDAYFRSLDEATRRATAGCADSLAPFKNPGA